MTHDLGDHAGRLAALRGPMAEAGEHALKIRGSARISSDPPPAKWSDLMYVIGIEEDHHAKEAIQA
jgi:hypothetical protein